jgi:hypothetical protein
VTGAWAQSFGARVERGCVVEKETDRWTPRDSDSKPSALDAGRAESLG